MNLILKRVEQQQCESCSDVLLRQKKLHFSSPHHLHMPPLRPDITKRFAVLVHFLLFKGWLLLSPPFAVNEKKFWVFPFIAYLSYTKTGVAGEACASLGGVLNVPVILFGVFYINCLFKHRQSKPYNLYEIFPFFSRREA